MGTDYIGSEDPSEEANGMSEARNLGSKIDRRDGFSVFLPSRPRFPTRFTSHPSSRRLFPRVLPPRRGPEGEARRTRGDASRADEVNRVNRGGELGGYEGSFTHRILHS